MFLTKFLSFTHVGKVLKWGGRFRQLSIEGEKGICEEASALQLRSIFLNEIS